MKKNLLVIAVCLNLTFILTGQTIKIFHENKNQGYIIYGTNSEFYPVSISLDLNLTNLHFSEGEQVIFVIPPKSEKFKIGELTVAVNGGQYKFNYKYLSTLGDVTIRNYDMDFEYDLPYQRGKKYNVYQGYNGAYSHQNENAIDFTMPEGTEVLAARDGVVVQVVQHNTESCPAKECEKYNNYVTVMHADGTYANYAHIKYNGSSFKPGDKVRKGDIIAHSGNVGRSSGPHLHFVCFLGAFGKWNSLETKFRIDSGDQSILLSERNAYLRDY